MSSSYLNRLAVALPLLGLLCVPLSAATSQQWWNQGGLWTTPSHATTFTVTSTADTVDAAPGDGVCADTNGDCTLRAAIQEANALGTGVTITLQAGLTYTLTLAGTGENLGATGDLDVTSDVYIDGMGSTIDAAGLDRGLDVLTGGILVARNLTITNGTVAGENGGGVRSVADVTLRNVTINTCTATGTSDSGGGIYNDAGNLTLLFSTVEMCTAEVAGGGVAANAGQNEVHFCKINDNTAGPSGGSGGGLSQEGAGTTNIRFSVMRGNAASQEGGGLWNSVDGTMKAYWSDISNNDAAGPSSDDGGGGIFNDGGDLNVTACWVNENSASGAAGSGGAIFNNAGNLDLIWCLVKNNSAMRAGGGVEAVDGVTNIWGCWINSNAASAAPGNGGAFHQTGAGVVAIQNCLVKNNTAAAEGGGLWNSATGTMNVKNVTLRSNTASGAASDEGGGGIFNDGGALVIHNVLLSTNSADGVAGSGGGILNNGGTVTAKFTFFRNNTAERAGGGYEENAGTSNFDRMVMIGNMTGTAPGNGGGLHMTGAGTVVIDRAFIRNNTAVNEGGGVWNSATGTMTLTNSTVVNNNAPTGADAFNSAGGTLTINGTVIP